MGSEPVRVKGKAGTDTMIQEDNIPDRTKLVVLGVIVLITLLACLASGAGRSQTEQQQTGFDFQRSSVSG